MELSILILISLILIIGWTFGYRFFGDGASWLGWLCMGIPHASLCAYGLHTIHGVEDWSVVTGGLILTSYLSVLLIRKLNPWGEFFPEKRKPLNRSDIPNWMFPLINKLAGFTYYDILPEAKVIHWKLTGWIVRHTIFGMFSAIVLSVCFWTVTPIFLTFFMGLGVAYAYGRTFLKIGVLDKVKSSERRAGFLCGCIQVIGIL